MQAPSLRKSEFFTIEMRHVPTSSPGKLNRVQFEGWVTEFSDQFISQWNEEYVYGRMDPLSTFERTSRKIQLAFDIVSDNAAEAQQNLINVNKLITFLYPAYTPDRDKKGRIGNTLQGAPLIQMRWTNLISNAENGGFLTGYLGGVNYSPRMEDGGFVVGKAATPGRTERVEIAGTTTPATVITSDSPLTSTPAVVTNDAHLRARDKSGNLLTTKYTTSMSGIAAGQTSRGTPAFTSGAGFRTQTVSATPPGLTYIPKTLNINLDYTVLHTHLMGWTESNNVMSFGGGLGQRFPNANVMGNRPSADQGILTTDPETGQTIADNAPGNNPVVDSFLAGVLNPDGK